MGIEDDDVAHVRSASDIVAVVSQYVQLRKVGAQWSGRCPFHTENTPSFSVNPNDNVFYCFGCQAKGDVISFVQMQEGLDFPSAVEWLAAKMNYSLTYTDRQQGEGRKKRARLVEHMERAADWFHQRLLTGADAGAARSYLRSRGLDGDVVREFRIGWAPDSWDDLCRGLGLDERAARDTGLGKRNSRGRLQDHFRARIMFPIADDQGNVISFGGRILPGGERPGNQGKYQNTTETTLYTKSRVLYGLDRAKKAVVSENTVVICEGYTDVIGFHRSGVPLAVATCGTALTDDHVTLLRRFAKRFVLAFDADGAGQAAAERFYRWEREHDLEVAVADLPPGQDPGDLAQSDPDRLPAAVANARPFLRFRLDRAFAAADLSSPEGRARVAQRALDLVGEHPDVFVQDQYLMDVAARCRIEPDRLRQQFEQRRRQAARPPAPGGAGRSGAGPSSRPGAGSRSRGLAGEQEAMGRGGRPATGPGPSGPPPDRSRPGPGATRPSGPARSSRPPAPVEDGYGPAAVPNEPDELPPEFYAQHGTEPDGVQAAPDGPADLAGDPGWAPPPPAWEGGDGWRGPGRGDGRGDRRGGTGRGGGGRGRDGRGRDGRGGRDYGRGRPQGPVRGERPAVTAERRRAALEVLRHAVHDPEAVGPWLVDDVFDEPAHLAVFRSLVENDTHADAVAALPPKEADLLSRLLVEEPTHDPLASLCQLLRTVVWREMRLLNATGVDDPTEVLRHTVLLNGVLADLDHVRPGTATEAADRLLAWLGQRVGDGG